jgi:hypothetical protein
MSKIAAQKAWVTRKRNTLIEAYKNANSAGIKAGIARQFKNQNYVENCSTKSMGYSQT